VPDFWDTDILALATVLEGFPTKRVWVSMGENSNQKHLSTVIGAKFGRLSKTQDSLLAELLETISQNDGPDH
ncbi:MAG: hypothetical protein ACR2PB_13910, partial [Desulfocapsaceae bacterium]